MENKYWQNKFEQFEAISSWERPNNPDKSRLKLNEYRTVLINNKQYYEVKTQKPNITFLINIKNFNLLKNYIWSL